MTKEKDISGQISGVTLSSFLQMIEMEQKSCTIKIFTRKDTGRIFFANGRLIDAATQHLNHLDALYEILSWKNIVIELEKNEARKHDCINLPLMHVLMESARCEDSAPGPDPDPDHPPGAAVSRPSRGIPLKPMKTRDFCLEIGGRVLIDFDDLSVTFRSTLVGIEHGRYLLLKPPSPFGRVEQDLFKMNGMAIKALYRGTIYAFRSRLLGMITEPSPLMFIDYPWKIEHHELRSHKRFKCSIVAQAGAGEKERGGVIENISRGGCLCTMETFAADNRPVGDLLNNTLPFRCRFPGSRQDIRFTGEIRNARKRCDEISVGVQFCYPKGMDEVRNTINNYIEVIEYSGQNV